MKQASALARRITGKLKRGIDQLRGVGRPYFPEYFDQRQAIFIHIPKAAGMSVTLALFGREVGHWRVSELMAHDPEKTGSLFKFAFVRNPWDRLVSAYFFLRRGGMARHPSDERFRRDVINRYADFGDFVERWLNPDNARRQIHFVPQADFVCDSDGRVLVDFLGRYERLEEDFRAITRRLGVECELPHHNPSRHEPYSVYYTETTRQIAAEVYRRDLELFGYEFGQ